MTREQAQANLEKLGLSEVTSEQIDGYLSQMQSVTKRFLDKSAQTEKDAARIAELESQLEAIESQNLSDIEKANKEKEKSDLQVEDLKKQIKAMALKASLAEQGIKGEDAENLIASLKDGELDVTLLGRIILEREKAAANAKEKEIADNTTNPGGALPEKKEDEKPEDVINAESMTNVFGKKDAIENKNYYVLK